MARLSRLGFAGSDGAFMRASRTSRNIGLV
jgi:hypothetical protein